MICFKDDIFLVDKINAKAKEIANDITKRQVFYMYSQAEMIIKSFLLPGFLQADINSNDRGVIYFLYGDYHTGKSHLIKYFMALMEVAHPEYWEIHEQPIIRIDLNNRINTADQLLIFILDKLGRPIDPKLIKQWNITNVTKERLQMRLICLLELYGTRLLVLDECQKLLQTRNQNILDIFELLKDLSTLGNWNGNLRTQIVLCGTKDGLPLLEAADWIQGRTRTMQLHEVDGLDFGALLMRVYRDYISLGISEEWDLVSTSPDNKKITLNQDLALYIFSRTKGKVGLTIDMVRNAVLQALNDGRLFPTKRDFESVRLNEKTYLVSNTPSPKKEQKKKPKTKIRISLQDRVCKIKNCSKFDKPYVRYSALVQHYKMKHPDVELIYGAEQ